MARIDCFPLARCLRQQSGFTRVDMVIMVTCAAMLAAVAVPRFTSVSQEYRYGQTVILSNSVENAARQANALWRANGKPSKLRLDSGVVDMINGYPSVATLSVLVEADELSSFDFNDGSWQHTAVSRRQLCGVSYWPPARSGDFPVIRSHLSDC